MDDERPIEEDNLVVITADARPDLWEEAETSFRSGTLQDLPAGIDDLGLRGVKASRPPTALSARSVDVSGIATGG
jgi:hypothetical protein